MEIAKGLFESATEEQKDVLKLMGVEQPAQPTPHLTELCRQHIDALPESIKMLLEKQTEPEKAPTVTETSRKFKVATADLRELILKKSTLQLKINKTKTTYTDLLTEMQQLQEVLSKQQQEVTALQQELQDRVQAEQPPPGPSLLQTLQDLGVQISDEQAAKLAGFRFQVAEAEDAKLPTESEKDPPPPGNLPTDMGLALLCRKHLATRDVGTFLLEGCGFVAAEMRTGSANVLLVSIYLQNATPASHYPNADILAQLLPLLEKWQGPWFIMGDFNLTPLEISEAGLPARSKGVVIPPSEPSMDNGNTIDMVFVSRDLAGVTTVQTDPTAPHALLHACVSKFYRS